MSPHARSHSGSSRSVTGTTLPPWRGASTGDGSASESSEGRVIEVWNVGDRQTSLRLPGHTGFLSSLAWHPEGTSPRVEGRRRQDQNLGHGDWTGGPDAGRGRTSERRLESRRPAARCIKHEQRGHLGRLARLSRIPWPPRDCGKGTIDNRTAATLRTSLRKAPQRHGERRATDSRQVPSGSAALWILRRRHSISSRSPRRAPCVRGQYPT